MAALYGPSRFERFRFFLMGLLCQGRNGSTTFHFASTALGAGIFLGFNCIIALILNEPNAKLPPHGGFVLGSLYVIWPWKQEIYKKTPWGMCWISMGSGEEYL